MEHSMHRRYFLLGALAFAGLAPVIHRSSSAGESKAPATPPPEKIVKTNAEWKQQLTPEQYYVMREEGTERAFTSPLNAEKRDGTFVCAACGLPLFRSKAKYDSGTGWPSFYEAIPGAIETRTDYKLIYPRTEYHCARCGAHQGHVFKDGPQPTGLRYCNNGLALKFEPGE
jgi:peptide-methionine (R)-S-oxide reductase